ncbi:MAG TPA: pseudouridine synthase [Ktedonobacterales bacterium]|jgi:pseudouridine synthase
MPGADDTGEQGERLQKFLARAGVASRRHAEELIAAGLVMVNGEVVREQGVRVHPGSDEVRVRGELVHTPDDAQLYLMMNKPVNTLTTTDDPEGRRTVIDLLPERWASRRIYPVGRLDWDSEGLLLLTDDGALTLRLTHPRYALPKEYIALVEGEPEPAALRRMERGLPLEDETRPTAPARVRPLRIENGNAWISVEIHEGRNRQVRRMFEAIGHQVLRLRRVRIGPLSLGGLESGETRELRPEEVAALCAAVGLKDIAHC